MSKVKSQGFNIERRISRGIQWNLLGFAVAGACGLLMNLLIARSYPAWALGTFNQVLALFILGGQIGGFAIQFSVLYHVPRALVVSESTSEALTSALVVTSILSGCVVLIMWACAPFIGQMLNSTTVPVGLQAAAFGMFLFPLNKILLAYLNGLRRVRLYAVGNAARFVLIVAAILIFIQLEIEGQWIALCLTISELALFLGLMSVNYDQIRWMPLPVLRDWSKRHLSFGVRGVVGATLWELNTRVDVLVLGLMSDDAAVGIYSLASIFAEGLFQLIMVLRFNYDPIMTKMIAEGGWLDLKKLVHGGKRLGYMAMFVVVPTAVLLYPFVLDVALNTNDFSNSWPVFGILSGGILIAAGYIPFGGILQQGGHPGAQSLLTALVLITNLVGNIVLIPPFGVIGAAVATAFAQVMYVGFLVTLVRMRLAFHL